MCPSCLLGFRSGELVAVRWRLWERKEDAAALEGHTAPPFGSGQGTIRKISIGSFA